LAALARDQRNSGTSGSAVAQLDVLGLKCPLPALRTEADDPLAAIDIPHAVATGGHALIESSGIDGVLRFRIRKGVG
jgi:tRNA 2-thiouridine synthesizing protein A